MDIKQEIDFMIYALQVARKEIEYNEEYEGELLKLKQENTGSRYDWLSYQTHRRPNITLARENLKTVSRFSSIVSKELADIFKQ